MKAGPDGTSPSKLMVPNGTAGKASHDTRGRDSHVEMNSVAGILEYQGQYDPNQDFAIFGIGDQTKGGVQNLQ